MALSTTQVNAAYVALLGRAAEGNANAWAENSADTKTLANAILSVDGKFATIRDTGKASIEQAKTDEDFVEALYQTILGRPADADGKDTWLNALANGTSRDELKANFLAAAKANNENLTTFYNDNQQFLSDVYSALLNRGVDNSGLETWMNLLQNGVSRAEVVAKIIEAINSNKDSEDYAIYNAKMSVADAVTAAFAGPKAGLNAEQNEELNKKLVNIMSSVASADVTEESIKAEIEQVVGSYGKEAAPLTFKAVTEGMEKYDLGNADSTTAQTFKGNINLQNADKSTINDKATLNTSKFSDTLIVDVIPSTAGAAFDYNDNAKQVKTFAEQAGIKNLTINNGTAEIKDLDNTGISENLKITGAANVAATVKEALNYLEVNTGGKADAAADIKVNANLKEYVGKGVGKDNITVSGDAVTVDTINTGAGNDTLIVNGSGSVTNVDLGAGNDELIVSGANASITGTINLGAGEDELIVSGGSIANAKINLGANNDVITITSVKDNGLAGATIDGGAGRDTLIVSGDISGKGVFNLSNVEVLEASGAGVKVSYSQIKDQALTLTKSGNADKLEINADNETAINLNLNNKVVSGETALDKLDLTNVGSGANSGVTVTLNKDDGIAETINLAADASGDKAVKITGLGTGDILKGDALDAAITAPFVKFTKAAGEGASTALKANAAYWINTNADVSTAEKALAALGNVTLDNNKKALVAFNTDNGTYIYSVSGAQDANLKATNFTLAAIVDDKINNKDSVAGGVITFTADDTPKELKALDVAFTSLGENKLDLADTATYSDANAITVDGVNGALTVSGANAQINKVDAFITAANGKVTKDASVTSNVNVYLGSGNQTLDFNQVENNAIASGADTLHVNTTGLITLKDASKFGDNLKLDLDKDIASNIAISGAATDDTDLNDLFDNADSNDTITLNIAKGASSFDVTLSSAKETLILKNTDDGTNIATIKGFATGTDKANIVAQVTAASASGDFITPVTSTTNLEKGKIYWTTSDISTATKAFALFNNSATYATAGKDLFVSVSGGETNVYLLSTDSTAGAGDGDTITLLAKFDSELAQGDFVNA